MTSFRRYYVWASFIILTVLASLSATVFALPDRSATDETWNLTRDESHVTVSVDRQSVFFPG